LALLVAASAVDEIWKDLTTEDTEKESRCSLG